MKKLLGISTALGMMLSAGTAYAEFSLSILHFNDFHSRFESVSKYDSGCSTKNEDAGKCFGGIARLKTMIDKRRAALSKIKRPNLLLVAGDAFQGTLYYTQYKGKATADFFNDLAIDAFALGNHEFDDGPEVLADFIGRVGFPILGGNTMAEKEPKLKGKIPGYRIVTKNGEKIGIIGIVTTDTAEIAAPGKNVTFENNVAYLKKAIPEVEAKGVNKIIVVSHAGYREDQMLAKEVPGIDVIVGGHSNTLLSNSHKRADGPYPTMVYGPGAKKVAIVQAYAYSKFLGELRVSFKDNGDVSYATGNTHELNAKVKPDEGFIAKLKKYAAPLEELKNRVVSEAAEVIGGDRKNCRAIECQMGNLVAEAMLDRVKDQGVSIAIQNGGGLRASIAAGKITMGDILTVLPFSNALATFTLTGADVVAALENGVSRLEDGAGRFAQVAGLRYAYDKSKEAMKGRITQVQVMKDGDWADIDPAAEYGVVSNNYMRSGGDGYKVFKKNGKNAYDFGPGLEEVVVAYLQNHAPYKPFLDGRIIEGKTFGMAKMMDKAEDTMAKKVEPAMKKMAKKAEPVMKKMDKATETMAKKAEPAMKKMAKKAEPAMKKMDKATETMAKKAEPAMKKMAKKAEPAMKKMDKEMKHMDGDYVVKAGDNLWNIAKKHYGDANMWKKIKTANNIGAGNGLEIGQSLKLPK